MPTSGRGSKESYATWAHPGDIQCEHTDTGVLLTMRQPKKASFAVQNEKGFLLEIFTDPKEKTIKILKRKDTKIIIENI
ncbi:MAG: hypothetical protein COU47_00960 [Candidatus Niyogibacteria bacterium CG10_big_fil_rev_8_21_14_0_10_46_36]|uniref:Uncharacterized protein n=1 Tax=Candidatus Niyogibacteria bacterium CG10_big_fil_rev_8_21_14_0_10_46_36 TaxID=1974726 RepID=A0A2H0TEK5_9BACT|nr:MAG: hypothetical protein COU47_00960 [Candidatus Niyogibacteria bacterium CG10_big_fil_rev_8_21_14_0_10_46_36]